MAASVASEKPVEGGRRGNDPFVSGHLRYSNFDSQLFALGPAASPGQAKRALEAHLAETERRMEEAGKLGTTLVQQRKELAERLKEVEQLQTEGELTPELRQKLVEIEKDYNEVARESARAFLPKQRVPSNELAAGSPYAPEGKGGRRSVSPSKFESQATGSPTKLAVPNRKLRNQPNRVHDIEFAAEISTSLLAQVRNLQALLAEREEELRDVKNEKSKIEIEAEGFQQRVKTLDESEHRYKDENWNLETQIHELIASQKDASDREKKLGQTLSLLQAEKSSTQRELDEVKLNHSKLSEEHAAAVKQHDIELGTAKRSMVMAEGERSAMQRKIEDLTGQNQELAKAFAMQRGRALDRETGLGLSDEEFETAADNVTPEHSPPPSPVKGTPRHSMLESETMKTSLHHAQRTIQSLRTNVHREKTEKLELKRMLQEARDEVERLRGDPSTASSRRSRKVDSREFKKPGRLGQLGGARASRSDIYLDEENWEDQQEAGSPAHSSTFSNPDLRGSATNIAPIPESSDHFETAHDTSDAAFETAHERGTETDDFQTGVENMSDEDAATETESPSKGLGKSKRPSALSLAQAGSRLSFQSTASTSNDEEDYTLLAQDLKTPTSAVPPPQKMRLRVSRGGLARRGRVGSEEPALQSSPASFANSSFSGTPQQPGQSLYAELGDLEGSEDESVGGATPARSSIHSAIFGSAPRGRTASPPPAVPALPRAVMVDSATMTDPLDNNRDSLVESSLLSPQSVIAFGRPTSMASHLALDDGHLSRPLSSVSYSDSGVQHEQFMEEKLAQFPSPPTSPPKPDFAPVPILPPPQALSISAFRAEDIQPRSEPEITPSLPQLSWSTTGWKAIEPRSEPEHPELVPPALSISSFLAQKIDPRKEPTPSPPAAPALSYSLVRSEVVQPVADQRQMADQIKPTPALRLSSILSQDWQPVVARESGLRFPRLSLSSIYSVDSEPVEARSPKRNAFIIPRDSEDVGAADSAQPVTPTKRRFGSLLDWGRGKSPATPVIAEDETRQSPNETPLSETPESQRPLKEMSSNSNARPQRKQGIDTADQSAQTLLTAEAIAGLLAAQQAAAAAHGHERMHSSGSIGTPSTVRHRRSQDSMNSVVRAKGRMAEAVPEYVAEAIPLRRTGSAASARASLIDVPPLPPNHKEVIEAARTGSAGGGPGTIGSMGPPPLPASALRAGRPRTPVGPKPSSPVSARGTPTPRAIRTTSGGTNFGTAEPYTPSRATHRSRQSSVSSFVSELDSRFNMQNEMGIGPAGFGPNTDPRMIQAITQTMIGEYLWKYTRKAGRGDMSKTRHRRYFWVHPYTRTLYWSERDPSSAGSGELRAKSVPIEAVRVVTDDNPMPPGLHRKSLVIISTGRSVKFTCTTGQRHETWFNALSYLLLRTNNNKDGQTDVEDMAGHITQEDVDEFNPQYGRRLQGTGRPRPPPSLSSYSSRQGRSDSPAVGSMNVNLNYPTLTPTHHQRGSQQQQQQAQQSQQPQLPNSQTRPSFATFSRLSGYWKDSKVLSGTFNSLRSRSRSSVRGGGQDRDRSLYEASEAHDSAEDLRQMIEKQDRESDRLENVRACCDGRHDVGTLPHSSKRGRHSHPHGQQHTHTHTHPTPSATPTPMGTVASRA